VEVIAKRWLQPANNQLPILAYLSLIGALAVVVAAATDN